MKRTDVVEQAQAIRNSMDKLTGNLTDEDAVSVADLFLPWAAGVDYSVGDRRRFSDALYKCAQAHTSQTGWEPPNVHALWVVIDAGHAGTIDDPIPAARGMEYVYGLYYSDSEDGKLYLCQRTGEAYGGTVVLQYMPHELVGHYFVEVT